MFHFYQHPPESGGWKDTLFLTSLRGDWETWCRSGVSTKSNLEPNSWLKLIFKPQELGEFLSFNRCVKICKHGVLLVENLKDGLVSLRHKLEGHPVGTYWKSSELWRPCGKKHIISFEAAWFLLSLGCCTNMLQCNYTMLMMPKLGRASPASLHPRNP